MAWSSAERVTCPGRGALLASACTLEVTVASSLTNAFCMRRSCFVQSDRAFATRHQRSQRPYLYRRTKNRGVTAGSSEMRTLAYLSVHAVDLTRDGLIKAPQRFIQGQTQGIHLRRRVLQFAGVTAHTVHVFCLCRRAEFLQLPCTHTCMHRHTS